MLDNKKKLTLTEQVIAKKTEIQNLEAKYKQVLDVAEQTKQQGFEFIGQLKLLEQMLAEETADIKTDTQAEIRPGNVKVIK